MEDLLQKSLRKESNTAREKGYHISANIVKGATFLSNGLVKGAEKTSSYINDSAPGLLNYINPAQSDRHVCSKMKKGVRVAKNVTSTAADVTSYVGTIFRAHIYNIIMLVNKRNVFISFFSWKSRRGFVRCRKNARSTRP